MKAPSTVEIEIQSRLNTLKNNPTFFSSYNSNLPPPSPSSPFQLLSFQLLQPPTFRASPTEFRQFQLTPPPVQNNFNFRKTKTTTPFGELRAEKTLEDSKQGKLQWQIDNILIEIAKPPKLELGNPLLNILSTKVADNLKTEYVNDKDLNDKETQDIKEEYNFEDIKML